MSDLLPCPFCGREVEYESFDRPGGDHKYGVRVLCDHDSPSTESAVYAEAVGKTFHEAEEALLDEWNTRHERTCTFTLEDDREVKEERAKAGSLDVHPCDIPMAWTCSACGIQFSPKVNFPPKWMNHCPNCGAKVVKDD